MSSSLLETAINNCATAAQTSPAVTTSPLIACAQGTGHPHNSEQLSAVVGQPRVNTRPPCGPLGTSAMTLTRGQPRGRMPKSIIRPHRLPGTQQKVLVGGRAIQASMMQQGTATNIVQQQHDTQPQSRLVTQPMMMTKTTSHPGRQINHNKVVTVGGANAACGAVQHVVQAMTRSPRSAGAPLRQQLRHVNPGGLTLIRTSTGQMIRVPTSSLQTPTGQRLAGCNIATPSTARTPSKTHRFVARPPVQSPVVDAVTPPRTTPTTVVAPVLAPSQGVSSVSDPSSFVSSSPLGSQMKIIAETANTTLVVGQEYALQYPNGRTLNVIWDGKFFKLTGGKGLIRFTSTQSFPFFCNNNVCLIH